MTEKVNNPDEYNGWTNRETWAVNLWLSNDQGVETTARDAVTLGIRSSRREADKIGFDWTEIMGINRGGELLRQLVDGYLSPEGLDEQTRWSMATDCGSLWRVDWAEVARAFAPEPVEAQ